MKILGLFRHAKSDWDDPHARDFDRPLNARGRKGAKLMGRHIRDYGVHWDRVIASPALRSAETIERASADDPRLGEVTWDRRIYLASPETLCDLVREQDDALGNVLLVGHNPGLEELIFTLVRDDGSSPLRDSIEAKFPTATFAVLELAVDRWRDVREGCARIVHVARPRDLDPSLGPELMRR
ncbi:MAG: histidine phosphatase family protein [Novosphingobium sp.]|nr:histidine phosphatase family protein [Novosphingobium sp.]